MIADLGQFHGHTAEQLTNTLIADGYREIPSTTPLSRVFRDAQETHLVRLSNTPSLSAAFCAASRIYYRANPDKAVFLPQVFRHATINPSLHVAVTENLLRLDEAADPSEHTLFGHARAVSSLFAGDEMHKDVHRCMTLEPSLLQAIRMIIRIGLGETRKTIAAETRQQGQNSLPAAFAINPQGDSIWFRCNGSGFRTVYADPFCESTDSPKDILEQLTWMDRRFKNKEIMAASSRFWRDRAP